MALSTIVDIPDQGLCTVHERKSMQSLSERQWAVRDYENSLDYSGPIRR
jgi:hypothetical protein